MQAEACGYRSLNLAMSYDCLIHNALVLTLEPGVAPICGGYVAVKDGKIAQVGPAFVGEAGQKSTRETPGPPGPTSASPPLNPSLAHLPPAREYLDAQGGLVLPGLVNTHCHAAMVWFRGLADDLPLKNWLEDFIFPAEAGWLDEEKVYWGALLAAAELIRGGVTTVADGYFFASAVRRAFQDAGLRGVVAQGLVDFPAPGVQDPKDNLRVAAEFLDSGVEFAPRLSSAVFCHSPYTCGPETLRRAKDLTRGRGVPLFLHLSETREEVAEIQGKTGLAPVAYLDRLGVLDEATVAVHAIWLTEEEQELLARRGVKVSHCPESNMKLAAGAAPVAALLDRGVAVGLGTDGAGSNNNLDMWGEMSMAARLHKVLSGDPTVLPAAQVVALATREGAKVLDLDGRVGTLTPGAEADLIVLDASPPHLTPLFDPFSHLVYAARAADVRHVMVGGRWLLRGGRLTTLDWPAIARRVQAGSRELASFCRNLRPRP